MITINEFTARLDKVSGGHGKFRAACPAHGGKDANLSIWVNEDGTIGTKCYSHGCDRKDVIEAVGFTLSDILPDITPNERKVRVAIKNRFEIEAALLFELLILYRTLDKRRCDRINKCDKNFIAENPQFAPHPEDPWDRELLAAKRIITGIGGYYET